MAWVESHQEIARHPKTRRLARLLGVSVPTAIGHLHLLWWFAMDFASDGEIGQYDPSDVADAVMWEGEPDALIAALSNAGFLESKGEGEALTIHDWDDYAGRLIEKRAQDAERKRMSRRRPADVHSPSGVTVPNRTVPDRTQPDLTGPLPPTPSRNGGKGHAAGAAEKNREVNLGPRTVSSQPFRKLGGA